MRKASILIIAFLFTLLVFPLNTISSLDLSSSDCGFGFQNGSYIYFRDPISVSVEQIASSNATYGDWVFVQKDGSSEIFGFYSTGVNVIVNTFFIGDILELACTGVGTVKVQVCTRSAPSSVSGTTSLFDQTNRIAVIDVTSSTTVQLNWNPLATAPPGGGGGGGTETTAPTETPSFTIAPSVTPSATGDKFKASNINLGEIQPNSTVTATLHFVYSGSSISLQSLNLPEPFNSWYVPSSDFSTKLYTLSSSGQNEGTATLTFYIPDINETSFVGDFVVTAKDAFGASLTSTATITAGAARPENTGLIGLILANPLIVVAVIAVFIVVAFYLLLRKR